MADLVYPPVVLLAKAAFRALDLRITLTGTEHVPRTGGAILAGTHVSYLDFIFIGLAAQPSRRLVRFLAKKQVFDHPVAGPLMRGMHHVSVDRSSGAPSYEATVRAVRAGEVVGVHPEATISRSFEVKEFKTGAARVALDTGAPLLPVAVWGTQRLWTKGRPRRLIQRGIPISVAVGPPVVPAPGDDAGTLTAKLGERMRRLLGRLQEEYGDRPTGGEEAWWLPAAQGGTAPTPEQARALDEADRARRTA